MRLTARLVNEVRDFLRAELAVENEFEHTVAELDEMRGSAFFNRKMDEAAAERDTALARCRARASEAIDPLLNVIEQRLDDAPLVPPTDEQLRALQLLAMKQQISADELRGTARLCEGCPSALALVAEVAASRGLPLSLPAPTAISSEAAREHLSTARRSLDTLIYRPSEANWSAAFLLNDDDDHLLGRLCGVWAGRDGRISGDYVRAMRAALDGNAE